MGFQLKSANTRISMTPLDQNVLILFMIDINLELFKTM